MTVGEWRLLRLPKKLVVYYEVVVLWTEFTQVEVLPQETQELL